MPQVCSSAHLSETSLKEAGGLLGPGTAGYAGIFVDVRYSAHSFSLRDQSFLLVRACLEAEVEVEVLRAAGGTLPRWHLVPMELRPILGAGWVKASWNTRALSQSLRRPAWEAARFSGWNKRIEDADGPGLIIPGL